MPYPLVYNAAGSTCSGKAQPGMIALRNVVLRHFSKASDWGIYSCRKVVGGSSMSVHGEGRAWDCGFPGQCNGQMYDLADFLQDNAATFGIQLLIRCRQIWGGSSFGAWRTYTGSNPHTDHLHVELQWAAATGVNVLTEDVVEDAFVGAGATTFEPLPPEPYPTPAVINPPIVQGTSIRLVRRPDKEAVFAIVGGGVLVHIPDGDVFGFMGYDWADVEELGVDHFIWRLPVIGRIADINR